MKQTERLTVGMAQTLCVPGDIDANLVTIEAVCSQAAQKGVALILFSEVALTGSLQRLGCGRTAHEYATKLPGPETDRLTLVCRELGVSILVGTVELGEDGKLYKSAFVVTPNGYEGKYRKNQPAPEEREEIDSGFETPLFRIQGWTMAIGVCWDLYFPELAQLYASKGADLYVLPTGDNAYPLRNARHAAEKSEFNRAGFRKVGPARACDNSMYVFIPVDANSAGGSVAFDPTGEQIAFGRAGEELIPVELRLDLLTETRPGFLPYWRSDIFSQLAENTSVQS
jgi:predicted amidohydrolase